MEERERDWKKKVGGVWRKMRDFKVDIKEHVKRKFRDCGEAKAESK